MAKLFLSYSRKDEAKARRFSGWLERAGHDVWRDRDDIGGGASFSAEIEKALEQSDAVLVLWSKDAVLSPWVRDEAGVGRDSGKLIPFSLDGTEAPLGFRQFQSMDLSHWRAGQPTGSNRIRQAIERVSQFPPPDRKITSRRRFERAKLWPVIAATVVIAVAIAALLAWQQWRNNRDIVISVVPSLQSPDHAMATDYANVAAADMAAFLPRRFDRVTVIAPADAASGPTGYRMQISTDPHGASANASLTLSDENGQTTLWSQNWTVADAAAGDLKADVSAAASKAALCLLDAKGGREHLSQPALGLYLNGCIGLAGTKLSNEDFETIFERVTKLAPDFPPGWDYLALSRSWIAASLHDSSPAAYAAALRTARDTIWTARRLNPNSAIPYDAEYHLIYNDPVRALSILDKAIQVDPNDGLIQMHRSDELLSVGRMADSVQAAQQSVELEPAAPYPRSQYILALIYSGEFSNAKAAIAEARKKWPDDRRIDYADFELQYRYGDPQLALNFLPRVVQSSDADLAPYRAVLAARIKPSPGKVDDAIASLKAGASNSPAMRNNLLSVLGSYGRIDEAYAMLDDPQFQPLLQRAVLFRPEFSAVRADSRFMGVAARLGLIHYWRETGYWPDFCSGGQLHYNCKAEAAKYPR